ncbi:MAG: hypothetical protein Q9181_002606 [Wetmoreana brouardii]
MLAEPITALFTATTIALIYILCNIFQSEIAAFFATPMLPPRDLRRGLGAVRPNPLGNLPFALRPTTAPEPIVSDSNDAAPPAPLPSSHPQAPSPPPDPTETLPPSAGKDEYYMYTGNGSVAAGWPRRSDWLSYEDMYIPPHFFSASAPFHPRK